MADPWQQRNLTVCRGWRSMQKEICLSRTAPTSVYGESMPGPQSSRPSQATGCHTLSTPKNSRTVTGSNHAPRAGFFHLLRAESVRKPGLGLACECMLGECSKHSLPLAKPVG